LFALDDQRPGIEPNSARWAAGRMSTRSAPSRVRRAASSGPDPVEGCARGGELLVDALT